MISLDENSKCPPIAVLLAFLDAALDDGHFEKIAAHTTECHLCEKALEELEEDLLPANSQFQASPAVAQLTGSDLRRTLPSSVTTDVAELVTTDTMPDCVGDYDVLELIGRGGMGVVYRGRHRELNRTVALKFLPLHRMVNPNARKLFDLEMKAAGRCQHPNIVQTFDARKVQSWHFIVMEYVDGCDVASLLRRHDRLSVNDACWIASQVAVALEYTRRQGLVHHDVKPSNVMISQQGHVKLLDLGLSALNLDDVHLPDAPAGTAAPESGSSRFPTREVAILGTAAYMSPEQWRSPTDVDIRADIYGLGCTFFHMLTGQAPFRGQNYGTM